MLKLGDNELVRIEPGDRACYCTNCKADCGLCSGTVLKGHKAVWCDSCDMWIRNEGSFIAELFPETCPYSVYRKDRNIHGGGVILLVHKDISHMPITELENDSESIWVKVFANETSHFVASWYRPSCSTSEEFQLFREQLDYIRTHHKGKNLPSVHVLGDFNFKDTDWPDSKSGSTLSQSERQILIDIMNDHGLVQMVYLPTGEKNTLDLILTTLPGQFKDVHSPDKLSDHDIISGTLKLFIPTIKKPRRKVYLYQKGDYEPMRKDTLEFANEKYFIVTRILVQCRRT